MNRYLRSTCCFFSPHTTRFLDRSCASVSQHDLNRVGGGTTVRRFLALFLAIARNKDCGEISPRRAGGKGNAGAAVVADNSTRQWQRRISNGPWTRHGSCPDEHRRGRAQSWILFFPSSKKSARKTSTFLASVRSSEVPPLVPELHGGPER